MRDVKTLHTTYATNTMSSPFETIDRLEAPCKVNDASIVPLIYCFLKRLENADAKFIDVPLNCTKRRKPGECTYNTTKSHR